MFFSRLVKITLILFVVLGFFSKFHPSEEVFGWTAKSQSFVSNTSVIDLDSERFSLENAMQIHACHIGHGGCFFNLPNFVNVDSFLIKSSSNFLFLPRSYLNPDLKQVKRPPIS